MNYETLTADICAWHDDNWPGASDYRVGCKLAEETGEVNGAIVKRAEGRKTDEDLLDELGDVMIVVSVLAGRLGTTPEMIRRERWETIQHRTGALVESTEVEG